MDRDGFPGREGNVGTGPIHVVNQPSEKSSCCINWRKSERKEEGGERGKGESGERRRGLTITTARDPDWGIKSVIEMTNFASIIE